jgi:hypothetical protein
VLSCAILSECVVETEQQKFKLCVDLYTGISSLMH